MTDNESTQFPLVKLGFAANAKSEWVALIVRVSLVDTDESQALHSVFGTPDLLAAVAPLDCILLLDSPDVLSSSLLSLMPAKRVGFSIDAGVLAHDEGRAQLLALHAKGYRILLDGAVPAGCAVPPELRAVAHDCGATVPVKDLASQFGPHLAREIGSGVRLAECASAGFDWFSGDYPLSPLLSGDASDGTSRKRLLALLGLLARDAESRELELMLKQDPALSFHLLKLVNSAAFALSTPISSFGQAISVLGRRQLQRWLQLLLYARGQADGGVNPLLGLAALRAAQLEALCKVQGGQRDDQDMAFMTGVFSLLDVLFEVPMDDIVSALNLARSAARALVAREGQLGALLQLVASGDPTLAILDAAGITPVQWWSSQLHAYHWAIQVSRNL